MDFREKTASEKRLIDADALHDFVSEEFKDDVPYEWAWSLTAVDHAPAVDAVPVVRCWDCKHCNPENYHCDHPMGTAAPLRRKPDDFCSYGERKEAAD